MRKTGGTLHLPDDRKECAVGVLRRAEIAQAHMRVARDAFHQCRGEPRFADACFAGKQHHLAFARFCLRPALKQKFEFFATADKLSQSPGVQCLETTRDSAWPQRGPSPCRLGDALEIFFAEALQLE